jgi:branched-chain amino acid transport system substrate-binding protein
MGALAAAAVVAMALVASAFAGADKSSAPKGKTTLPSSSCGPVIYKGAGKPQYLIASDLPMQGANRPQTTQMTKAIQFILEGRKWKAGNYTIGYQVCDDSTAQAGAWDSAKCTANARAYAADRSVIGVIGTFNSGCAKLEIPLLNRAGPLGMVSPANTYPGLTKRTALNAAGEPNIYYPTGKRNYARVVATDDFQGPADAMIAKRVGATKVYILTDNETYGKGVSQTFQKAAKKLGIQILGFEAWDPKASSYEALTDKIKGKGANGVFLGGIVCNNGAKLIKDLRAGLGSKVKLIGPDGFTPFSAVAAAGPAAEGMLISVAGLPNEALGKGGKKFIADFVKYQGRKPDPYAVYAAQAAVVMLDAIAKSNGSRGSVAANLFKTRVVGGILGSFTIDRNGDTSIKGITIYKMTKGDGKTYATLYPPVSLTK